MAQGRKTALTIHLTPADRETLLMWQRSTTVSTGRARRGRMLLLLADKVSISEIARTVGMARPHVYKWVQRFLTEGLEGLTDRQGHGTRRRWQPLTRNEEGRGVQIQHGAACA